MKTSTPALLCTLSYLLLCGCTSRSDGLARWQVEYLVCRGPIGDAENMVILAEHINGPAGIELAETATNGYLHTALLGAQRYTVRLEETDLESLDLVVCLSKKIDGLDIDKDLVERLRQHGTDKSH